MRSKKPEYKPLLFTTTVRNPRRLKGMLAVFSKFNGQQLTDVLAIQIVKEIIRYGLYRPTKQALRVKEKWKDTKKGEFAKVLLRDEELDSLMKSNPQNHKEAGFAKGWPSRFATIFDFAKELGFVYYSPGEKIRFSEIGLKLAKALRIELENDLILVADEHPEFEQQAFLHALTKYQRNNPFVKVLNNNVPLILLLEVINKLNDDEDFKGAGISKLELPLLIFWKNNSSEALYKQIKDIRKRYGYNPSWEVIVKACIDHIGGTFKKFKPKSIMAEYPDEFIRKMRLTGLITLRGGGRFIDINRNEQAKVDYVLRKYSNYKHYTDEKEYFDYVSQVDEYLFASLTLPLSLVEKERNLLKWAAIYPWERIKEELLILSRKGLSKDEILKYIPSPARLEFLTAIALKLKLPNLTVIPNYPYDDEGLPTSTAGGIGDKGDIECYEGIYGVLIEVTMLEGRAQTVMEVWPISRHLKEFKETREESMCYFIAPSIFSDSLWQIGYVKEKENLLTVPKTIEEFLKHIENSTNLYSPA